MATIKTAAVILSAGLSSRMGAFKPLLSFGSETALERVIRAFAEGGVADIIVVCGHLADDIRKAVAQTPAKTVFNPDFNDSMFTSVLTGIRALPESIDGFFVHPVDIPLITGHVIRQLIRTFAKNPHGLIYPCYQGQCGRPPLIPVDLREIILAADGSRGLRGILAGYSDRITTVDVGEDGILWDMDKWADYQRLLGSVQ